MPDADLSPTFTVGELTDAINAQLKSGFGGGVWVTGEISGYRDQGQHTYFSLVEDIDGKKAMVNVALFANVKLVPVIWLEVADLKVYWPDALRIVTMYPVAPETVFQLRTGLSSESSRLLVVS